MKNKTFYLIFGAAALVLFSAPLRKLLALSFHNELYSHIILLPLVSGYFLFMQRKEIFEGARYAPVAGVPLIAAGIALYLMGADRNGVLNNNDYLSIMICSFLVIMVGGFIFFYGIQSFKIASFPLLFLAFTVPLPNAVMESLIHFLRVGSTHGASALFKAIGIPYAREGYCFYLPNLSIEVAEECSGIRSSLSLVITAIIAGHLFLTSKRRKIVLVMFAIPIAVLKNSIRIVTLSLLTIYVDHRVLSSPLHHKGGVLFFVIGLLLLGAVLWALRKSEGRENKGRTPLETGAPAEDKG